MPKNNLTTNGKKRSREDADQQAGELHNKRLKMNDARAKQVSDNDQKEKIREEIENFISYSGIYAEEMRKTIHYLFSLLKRAGIASDSNSRILFQYIRNDSYPLEYVSQIFLILSEKNQLTDSNVKLLGKNNRSRYCKKIADVMVKLKEYTLCTSANLQALFFYAHRAEEIFKKLLVTSKLNQDKFDAILRSFPEERGRIFMLEANNPQSIVCKFFGSTNGKPNHPMGDEQILNVIASFLP